MAVKAKVQKFDTIDKATIKGRIGHTRTGACSSAGRCNHGIIVRPSLGKSLFKKKSK